MQGVVDAHLRSIYAAIGGIDLCVTEFVRVNDSALPAKVFKRSCPELLSPIAVPVRVQLLGSNPDLLARCARKAAKLGAPGIDLNFGCPAKTVNKNRGGACLLDEPELIYDIVSAVRGAVPEHTPVSVKIRLGFESRQHYVENALSIQEAGANELIVHARSKADGYKPPAYWEAIGEIQQALLIPVIANGEIWSVDDFLKCKHRSGCHDFMLGRGLLARPDLALAIKAQQAGQQHNAMPWRQVLNLVWRLHQTTSPLYPKKFCGNRMKQWLMYLQRQYVEAEQLFMRVKGTKDPNAIQQHFIDAGLPSVSKLHSSLSKFAG